MNKDLVLEKSISIIDSVETMTSLQISELTGKDHDKVCRDIKVLLGHGVSSANFIIDNYVSGRGKIYKYYKLTDEGISILATQYKNEQLASMCDKVVVHNATRFELSFGSMLTEMLNELGIGVMQQYNVDGYRIDFYLPDFNIAIEYDEAQHFYKNNIEKDAEREKYIKNKIGCKFIRLNYKDSDAINVAKVLKQITTIKK